MSDLQKQILDSVIIAMKSGEKERLKIIRLMTSAMKQIEVDERIELDDARIIAILDKMVKQRRDPSRSLKLQGVMTW